VWQGAVCKPKVNLTRLKGNLDQYVMRKLKALPDSLKGQLVKVIRMVRY